MASICASREGLELVKKAMLQKDWNKTDPRWYVNANPWFSESTLKRFWEGKKIRPDSFKSICKEVGLNWEDIAEINPNTEATWMFIISGTITEVDKAKAIVMIEHLQQLIGDVNITFKELKEGSLQIIVQSSMATYQRIKTLIESKEITEILGYSVLGIQLNYLTENVNLTPWLQNNWTEAIAMEWLTIEEVFQPSQFAFRQTAIKRAKLIDLDEDITVISVLELMANQQQELDVMIRIYPETTTNYLPENLKLALFSQSGESLEEFSVNSGDDCLEVNIILDPQDYLKIDLSVDEYHFTENLILTSN